MSRYDDLLNLYNVKRADWDPNDNTPRKNREVDSIDAFELHHTGGAGPRSMSFEDKLRWGLDIESYHENNKGWTDLFYNTFVFADGEIWGGRRADRSSQSNLMTALTVHIPGNNPTITEAQHQSLLRVARWCTSNPDNINVHSDRASTACPGANGRAERDRLQKELLTMPSFPPIQLVPEDLRSHEDYLAAIQKGFISDADPDRVASRSVAAVIANRVHDDAVAYFADLEARVNDLEEATDQDTEIILNDGVLDKIIQEIIKRLAE